MSYIINPWAVYLIAQADRIRGFAWVFSVVAVLAFVIATCVYQFQKFDTCYQKYKEEPCKDCATKLDCEYKRGLRLAKRIGIISGVISVISVLILIFLPSTETLIYIAVAKAATIENLNMVKETVKEAVDYIVSQVAALKG